jgi:hypothetical protein
VVTGILSNDGIISANGASSSGAVQGGGGAGGSVYVTAGSLLGSGSFTANGGAGGEGSGGGGRVAVYYGANSNFTGFTTSTATGGTTGTAGANGTVAFFDTSVPNSNLNIYQDFTIPAGSNASYNAVTVQPGVALTIGGGSLVAIAGTFTVSGTVQVQSINNMAEVGGSWQGAGVTINAAAVQVNVGGSLNADEQGYVGSAGPAALLAARVTAVHTVAWAGWVWNPPRPRPMARRPLPRTSVRAALPAVAERLKEQVAAPFAW